MCLDPPPYSLLKISVIMGKIVELSQHVANQIAAGEVVERPASVIKELLENALDAGASNIEVRIKNGGLSHIVVQDDGWGMDEDDLRLSIKRYATSKLSTVSDLDNISSFGFRGEALPSIASVCRMSIISRTIQQQEGHKVVVEAGAIRDLFTTSAALGTRIEVRDLFFNVPARLKFVKSKRAEIYAIDRLLKAYAFIHPNVGWKFYSENELVFSYKNGVQTNDFARAEALLGDDTKGLLYAFDSQCDFLKITGVICAPLATRRDSRGMVFFVNRRLIGDKKLTMAVKTAFNTLTLVGNNPVCALMLDLAPDDVDVNVHPRKAEVRFKDEQRIISYLISSLSKFLAKTPWLRTENSSPITSHRPPFDVDMLLGSGQPKVANSFGFTMASNHKPWLDSQPVHNFQPKLLSSKRFSDLLVIGQACSTYLLAQSEEGLVIIDQHAAHERIMFEKIKRAKEQGLTKTPLLIPFTIDLSLAELGLLEEHVPDLQALQIDVEFFGKSTAIIRSLPDFIKDTDIKALIMDLLSDLSRFGRARSTEQMFEQVCASLACHSSIRAGQRMNQQQIETLLIELDNTDFNAHCPHGRPIVKSFFEHEMKKWFERT